MRINWPLITVLFCLSIPGVVLAMKRLIYCLLPDNTEALKKRLSRLAISQTLFLVFILILAGAVLSPSTGLHATILEPLLVGSAGISSLYPILLPAVVHAFLGLVIFLVLYYGLIGRILDKKSLAIMDNIRTNLGIDGCVLYGGVVEEIIGRWGLMNLTSFFILLFTKLYPDLIVWISIFISGLMFAIGQLPIYLAAGCPSNRRFIYCFILLSTYQSFFFGYLFWQYGLIAAIITHVLFHLGWAAYDPKKSIQ